MTAPSSPYPHKMDLFNNYDNLHDFLSAFRVLFLSRCTGRGVAVFVTVFTSESNISSSASLKLSSRAGTLGDRCDSGRRRLNVNVPLISAVSEPSVVPSSCLYLEIKEIIKQVVKSCFLLTLVPHPLNSLPWSPQHFHF